MENVTLLVTCTCEINLYLVFVFEDLSNIFRRSGSTISGRYLQTKAEGKNL